MRRQSERIEATEGLEQHIRGFKTLKYLYQYSRKKTLGSVHFKCQFCKNYVFEIY